MTTEEIGHALRTCLASEDCYILRSRYGIDRAPVSIRRCAEALSICPTSLVYRTKRAIKRLPRHVQEALASAGQQEREEASRRKANREAAKALRAFVRGSRNLAAIRAFLGEAGEAYQEQTVMDDCTLLEWLHERTGVSHIDGWRRCYICRTWKASAEFAKGDCACRRCDTRRHVEYTKKRYREDPVFRQLHISRSTEYRRRRIAARRAA